MLETPHVAVGAAIATKLSNPVLALPLALGSHFLLDKMPHWNPHLNTDLKKHGKVQKKNTLIVAADATTALLLGSYAALNALPDSTHFATVMAASFLSVLPDIVEAPHYFLNKRHPLITKFIAWQKSIQFDVAPTLGIITQVMVVLISVILIFS